MRKLILLALIILSMVVSAQDTINGGNCKARFYFSVNTEIMTLLPSTAINFYDESDGNVSKWNWDFGDGETSNDQHPMHVYVHPTFPDGALVRINPYRTVSLTINTSDGCTSTFSQTINIYDTPVDGGKTCKSDFYFYQTGFDSLAQTASFKFINIGSAESASYLWNFSDGITSTDIEPEMTFDFSRTERKVCLTTMGIDSCSDELCQTVYIDPSGGGYYPGDTTYTGCFVAFGYTINYDYQTFAPALVLDFYSKTEDQIAKYLWDFGDGTSSDEPNPTHIFNYPLNVDSVFGDPNPYRTVCLTITTADGCESSWCQTIDIYTGEDTYNQECYAWFKYNIPGDVVTIPEVVPYKFFSTIENAVSWTWYFEDGTVSYDPEPLVTFDIFKPTQQVCLTITTVDSCTSKWCETIWVSPWVIDTIYPEPVCDKYKFRFDSAFPEWASACIGTVTAQVVDGDSLVDTEYYYWTSGAGGEFVDGPAMTNMCPTQAYTVTALTMDGCKFSSSIIFNSDGTVTEIQRDPINWWINGWGDDSYIEYDLADSSYTVEWVLCDGSVYTGLNVPLQDFNCGSNQPNLILKDGYGNIIYSEKIALRTSTSTIDDNRKIMLYPNPVENRLILQLGKIEANNLRFEISNLKGQLLIAKNISDLQLEQSFTIDVSSLSKGVYVGKLISDNKILSAEKFIK